MKNLVYTFVLSLLLFSCKTTQEATSVQQPLHTTIDLVNVRDDKVMVSIDPGRFTTDQTIFYIPKIIPGTYKVSDYGKFSEDFKALDYKGRELEVLRRDDNSWLIPKATKLDKVTYWVNDSFDVQGEQNIYSMAGTNILEGENFLLNLHAFVGYFQDLKEQEYRLSITRPSHLIAGSALTVSETLLAPEGDARTDVYNLNRYFEVIDNPIMYATPDTTSFRVQGMDVLLNVYSPTGKYSSSDIKPAMEKMVTAQKKFLGDINTTDKYAILLYLSRGSENNDAGNFGALEHHTSTVVVLEEKMDLKTLNEEMTDIVAHEFFHIITPLSIHSREVHYFDYNNPKMSKHLWMYEGIIEYFAHLFQVNQGLINEQEFFNELMHKINVAQQFDDTVPFTQMSENVLKEEYEESFYNVYFKGALIGMALDIRLRELSGGKTGVLDLMKALTAQYGKNRPFVDNELIPAIVKLTFPEIQEFFDSYVSGTTPIPYEEVFDKVGLEMREGEVPVDFFLKDQANSYIIMNKAGNIFVKSDIELNSFLHDLGLESGDMITSVNGTTYSRDNIYSLLSASQEWKEGDEISMTIQRNGEELTLHAIIAQPTATGMQLVKMPKADNTQIELRYTWLKS